MIITVINFNYICDLTNRRTFFSIAVAKYAFFLHQSRTLKTTRLNIKFFKILPQNKHNLPPFSSIVNEAIKAISIFLRNAKQTIFTLLEVFLREKLLPLLFFVRLFLFCWLALVWFAFLWIQNLFVNWLEIVLIASFTILLTCTPINLPIKNYLSLILTQFFLSHLIIHIYFYLSETIFHFLRLTFTCKNHFLFMIIFENLYDHQQDSIFSSLYENKQAYQPHHLKQIFYHQNMIMIFCWFRMFQIYVFNFELFSFCVWVLFC